MNIHILLSTLPEFHQESLRMDILGRRIDRAGISIWKKMENITRG